MDEAQKLREHAKAALLLAQTTRSEDGRASLISLAKIWLKLAERRDRQHGTAPHGALVSVPRRPHNR